MIRYALRCACGHGFDAWFASGSAYDDQAAKGLVACPACGAATVEKAPMAPAIARARSAEPTVANDPPATAPGAPVCDHRSAVRAALRAMVREAKRTTEDVGADFAREARRIHQGEAEARAIRGQASGAEARALRDDGIEVHPLPDIADHDA